MTRFSPTWRVALLAGALALGLLLRTTALDTYGFSEDEVGKLAAIEAYRHGEFSANAEHPMLMKLAIWASTATANRVAGATGWSISPESALRLPNVLAGTATIAAVAGASSLLFTPWVGVTAGVLVAFDPNVIAVNRVGKEDTFLLLFFFVAVWCYERAKHIGVHDIPRARRWYNAAGAAFGLMLASKYMPHFLGLYALFNVIHLRDAGDNSPDKRQYFGSMVVAFLVADFAVVLPTTWSYCLAYVQGRHLTHHGFYYAGDLYVTDIPVSPAGVPVTYYLRMIATKVPLPVLAAAGVGLVPLVRKRGERGFIWLRVMLVFLLLGYSFAAAKFQRYGLPLLLLVDILAAIGIASMVGWVVSRPRLLPARRVLAAGTCLAIVVAPLAASLMVSPFYSLQQNPLGARLAPPATTFPEEAYDYGIREAVREIATAAEEHAAIISDAPGVVAHYVRASGRRDLRVVSLSTHGVVDGAERWVIVQDGHLYFENRATISQLRGTARPWREYHLLNTPVLRLYRLPVANAARLRPGPVGAG